MTQAELWREYHLGEGEYNYSCDSREGVKVTKGNWILKVLIFKLQN